MKRHITFQAGLSAAAVILCCVLSGCATEKLVRNAKPTAFLEASGTPMTGKIARLPFDHAWREAGLDTARYSRLVIRPVTLNHLRTEQWKESASAEITSRERYVEHARELAAYWNQSLNRSFRGPGAHLELTGNPALPGTLVLEIALTEVVFGHPGTYAASYAVPFGGVAESAMFSPTVAFEARVRDAATGKIVATAADRRGTRMKIVDFNRLTISKPNKEICDEWAVQLMEAFNREMFPKVKRTLFTPF
ncbi:MAG: DUF3313 family protein [Verrucomicrobiota bacterium]